MLHCVVLQVLHRVLNEVVTEWVTQRTQDTELFFKCYVKYSCVYYTVTLRN